MYTDKELINMMEADLEKGAAYLFEEYGGLIWSICSRRLDNEEDIKECVNDVFADVCLHYKKYDSEKSSFKNYLCMIADRKAVDCFRKNVRDEAVKNKLQIHKYDLGEEDIQKLELALEQIKPLDSQILRMKYYDGMTYHEIASELGMKYETVKKRSQRSKKMLYLIIVGMLLALLIACASAIFKKYYYSSTSGFIWSEGKVYELVNKEEYFENTEFRCIMGNAFYQDNVVTIIFDLEQIGNQKLKGVELIRKVNKYVSNEAYLYSKDAKNRVSEHSLNLEQYRKDAENFKYILDFKWTEEMKPGKFTVFFGIEGIGEVKLELKPIDAIEYQEETSGVLLPGNSMILTGPAFVGEDFTSVNFYYYKEGEYKATPLLTNSYFGIGDRILEKAVLSDDEGNSYEALRVMGLDSEEQMDYIAYFEKIPEGHYKLKLPYICMGKEMKSNSVLINFPSGENNHLDCDIMFRFEDGLEMHVTGITRKEHSEIFIDEMGTDGVIREHEEFYWDYVLEYEECDWENNLHFCVACPAIVNDSGDLTVQNVIDKNHDPAIRVSQKVDVENLEIYFENPIFIWDQEIALDIVVQEMTE